MGAGVGAHRYTMGGWGLGWIQRGSVRQLAMVAMEIAMRRRRPVVVPHSIGGWEAVYERRV